MNNLIRRPDLHEEKKTHENLLHKEWLVANGLGGYASSTLAFIPTRKYHGILIASLPTIGRTVTLNHLLEVIELPDGQEIFLNNEERPDGVVSAESLSYLEDFYLDKGLPVWRYNCQGIVFEKRVFLTYMQNTVHILYTMLSGADSIRIKLFPYIHFRSTNLPVHIPISKPYRVTIVKNRYEVSADGFPSLRLFINGEDVHFTLDEHTSKDVFFRKEALRGYESLGEFWSPGRLTVTLTKNTYVSFLASTESWEETEAMDSLQALQAEYMRRKLLLKKAPLEAQSALGADLVFAADQFIIIPGSRLQDKTRANAAGDEVRTVIAGYHWFTDWGRDTMISLEGLTLCTGRYQEARWVLRTFAYYVKNGLIPNMFPEGEKEGLYHTADATLWFFHSLHRYLTYTDDVETLQFIFPKLIEIYSAHVHGTHFGIHVDPDDGLLIQGAEGYQLTWMDAKVDGWVVTPRRGKAVEINALWYNALRLLETWLKEEKKNALAEEVGLQARKVYQSFNQKFWNDQKGYLYDVIEGEKGNDDALRPNQLFAISLDHPVLDRQHWEAVFKVTTQVLLTPVGLRSLSPGHPDYKSRYYGDLRARDSAYHQGTVWSWLIGPYIDVWLKLYPNDKEKMHAFLQGFECHLVEAGIGYISEIFDATEPYAPRGCIAQAWSIAELLRCYLNTYSRSK